MDTEMERSCIPQLLAFVNQDTIWTALTTFTATKFGDIHKTDHSTALVRTHESLFKFIHRNFFPNSYVGNEKQKQQVMLTMTGLAVSILLF